ncbi:hypothetical protein [Vibrio phage BONAISHI]|nr:hypothetical protein [Vibrio phage BONAISHI]
MSQQQSFDKRKNYHLYAPYFKIINFRQFKNAADHAKTNRGIYHAKRVEGLLPPYAACMLDVHPVVSLYRGIKVGPYIYAQLWDKDLNLFYARIKCGVNDEPSISERSRRNSRDWEQVHYERLFHYMRTGRILGYGETLTHTVGFHSNRYYNEETWKTISKEERNFFRRNVYANETAFPVKLTNSYFERTEELVWSKYRRYRGKVWLTRGMMHLIINCFMLHMRRLRKTCPQKKAFGRMIGTAISWAASGYSMTYTNMELDGSGRLSHLPYLSKEDRIHIYSCVEDIPEGTFFHDKKYDEVLGLLEKQLSK